MIESYFLAERVALDYLEVKLGKRIARNLLFKSENRQIEIDGILQQEELDVIFEVKVALKNKIDVIMIKHYLERAKKIPENYKEITHRSASLRLVIVGNIKPEEKKVLFNDIIASNLNTDNNDAIFDFISYDDLGLKLEGNSITFKQ